MRVVWLSHIIPHPPVSGLLQRSFNLLREVANRHEVHLLAIDLHHLHRDDEQARESMLALVELCENVKIFSPDVSADRRSPGWWKLAASTFFSRRPYDVSWRESRELHAYLKSAEMRPDPQLVHVDTLGMYPYAGYFPEASVVLNHHNVESHMMDRRAKLESNPLKRLYFRREREKLADYEREVCAKVATNLVVSELEGDRLRVVAPGSETDVVENGVDTEYFAPVTPPGEGSEGLVFVGGMGWYPNREAVEYLLSDIWPVLVADNSDLTLTVVGRNPPEILRRAAKRDHRVRAPGFVDDMRPYVDRARAYVCPIRNGGGTRLKILDALAMAKPLIATEFAVEGLGLKEGHHFLRAETPEDYVRQVRKLKANAKLRRVLATEGRKFVEEQYSWKAIGSRMERAYRVTLGRPDTTSELSGSLTS